MRALKREKRPFCIQTEQTHFRFQDGDKHDFFKKLAAKRIATVQASILFNNCQYVWTVLKIAFANHSLRNFKRIQVSIERGKITKSFPVTFFRTMTEFFFEHFLRGTLKPLR